MSKKILYIVGEYPVITETFIQKEVEGLRTLGLDIDVRDLQSISIFQMLIPVLKQPILAGLLVKYLLRLKCGFRRSFSVTGRTLILLPCVGEYDQLHAHFMGSPSLVAHCLFHLTDIPYSLTAHAYDIYAEKTPHAVIKHASFRTTCTATNQSFLANKYPDAPFSLIRHGMDISQYTQAYTIRDHTPCHILAIGRLIEKKGFSDLLKACHLLKANDFPFRCTIVGEGKLEHTLKTLSSSLDLDNKVCFIDCINHTKIHDLYRSADCLVVPAVIAQNGDRDGVPNVVLEAMATGLPVIGTTMGSLNEVLIHNHTGLLIPHSDPLALSNAITHMWNSPQLRKTISRKGIDLVSTEFAEPYWLNILYGLLHSL